LANNRSVPRLVDILTVVLLITVRGIANESVRSHRQKREPMPSWRSLIVTLSVKHAQECLGDKCGVRLSFTVAGVDVDVRCAPDRNTVDDVEVRAQLLAVKV
jgi:hypothetical protein